VPPRASQGVSIHGKDQRGRLASHSSGCPVHALSAFLRDYVLSLAQEPIEGQAQAGENAPARAEAELSVAPDLIKRID
jgi:hypothetical protein